jgi:hypothetical protein
MIIGMTHRDLDRLKEGRKKKAITPRKKRTAVLSQKTKSNSFKKLEKMDTGQCKDNNINIDESVKMNGDFMRTGWYVPKKK